MADNEYEKLSKRFDEEIARAGIKVKIRDALILTTSILIDNKGRHQIGGGCAIAQPTPENNLTGEDFCKVIVGSCITLRNKLAEAYRQQGDDPVKSVATASLIIAKALFTVGDDAVIKVDDVTNGDIEAAVPTPADVVPPPKAGDMPN